MTDDILNYRRLHFIWLGSPMPDHLRANIYEWERLHPSWQAHVWTEQNIPTLRNADLYHSARKLVPRDAVYQFQADIIRYELLYSFGGFYADVDARPIRSIEPALKNRTEFAAAEDHSWVGNTVLGCTPKHRIMFDLVSNLKANVAAKKGPRPNKLSGPQYLTPIWRKHNGHVDPTNLWYPYSYRDVINGTIPDNLGNAYIEHQWHHTRSVLKARGRLDV